MSPHVVFLSVLCGFGAGDDGAGAGTTAQAPAPLAAPDLEPPSLAAPRRLLIAPMPPPAATPRSLLQAPAPGGLAEPPPDGYRLQRASDGSGDLTYETAGFRARIARDGSVTFRDRHVTDLTLLSILPLPLSGHAALRPSVPSLQDVILGLARKKPPPTTPLPPGVPFDPTPNETMYPSTTVSRFRPDTREACRYPSPCFFEAAVIMIGVSGKFDATDELMRLAGQDPYRYQKARFLTATREMRIRMAGRAHAEDVARSGADLPPRLLDIACDDRMSSADRRAVIVALGAELDGSTAEARALGDRIRRFVVDWGDDAGGGVRCPPR
jgi:hypothetical protein